MVIISNEDLRILSRKLPILLNAVKPDVNALQATNAKRQLKILTAKLIKRNDIRRNSTKSKYKPPKVSER